MAFCKRKNPDFWKCEKPGKTQTALHSFASTESQLWVLETFWRFAFYKHVYIAIDATKWIVYLFDVQYRIEHKVNAKKVNTNYYCEVGSKNIVDITCPNHEACNEQFLAFKPLPVAMSFQRDSESALVPFLSFCRCNVSLFLKSSSKCLWKLRIRFPHIHFFRTFCRADISYVKQ